MTRTYVAGRELDAAADALQPEMAEQESLQALLQATHQRLAAAQGRLEPYRQAAQLQNSMACFSKGQPPPQLEHHTANSLPRGGRLAMPTPPPPARALGTGMHGNFRPF